MRRENKEYVVMTPEDFVELVIANVIPPHVVHIVVICYKWVGAHIVVCSVAYIKHKMKK